MVSSTGEIVSCDIEVVNIPLRDPFVIAAGRSEEYTGVLLTITDANGLKGIGEASPSKRVTGEDVDSVVTVIRDRGWPILQGQDIGREFGHLLTAVYEELSEWPAALCAIDTALHDLYTRWHGISIVDLYGRVRDSIATSITLSIGSVEATLESAAMAIEHYGSRELKVKIGLEPERDIAIIRALREAYGNDIGLRADANTGYTLRRAIRVLKAIERYDVEFIEEPLPVGDIEGLRELRRKTSVPIMADESVKGPKDALAIVQRGLYDMINIKLMKCGGLRSAFTVAEIARAGGMECQVGCMIETPVGITAGTALALTSPAVGYADLDGFTFMPPSELERFNGGAKIKVGKIWIEDGLGLGVTLNS